MEKIIMKIVAGNENANIFAAAYTRRQRSFKILQIKLLK
jgi:hypothetical protein